MGPKNKKGKKKTTEGGESARTEGSNQNSFREKEETKTEEPVRKVVDTQNPVEPIIEEPKKEDDAKQNDEE